MSGIFEIDDQLDATLARLMSHYGLPSRASVLRRAVALLKVVSENEAPDHSFLLQREDESILCVRITAAPAPLAATGNPLEGSS